MKYLRHILFNVQDVYYEGIHVFGGLSECLHNETCTISFVHFDIINKKTDRLTSEPYLIKYYIFLIP